MKKVLNVGGGTNRKLPNRYNGWQQDVLDIDPEVNPDICCDALLLKTLEPNKYDAVYCSHNLEHFYKHEVQIVLAGFMHVLNEDGFVEIAVPNIQNLMEVLVKGTLDIDDVWYRLPSRAPITFHDVLYGWNVAVSQGNKYYSHKCGFTQLSLHTELKNAGFGSAFVVDEGPNLQAYAFKKEGMSCP